MDAYYLNKLPSEIRDLVFSIEKQANIEIMVEIDSKRTRLACKSYITHAKIFIPNEGHFAPGSVLHELLHIRRFCVENVPKIVICDGCNSPIWEDNLKVLDNQIEHLFIVQEEIKAQNERKSYWKERICRIINKLHGPLIQNQNQFDRDYMALYCRLFVHHVFKDSVLSKSTSAVIESLGLVQRFEHFFNRIVPALDSKERTTQIIIDFMTCLPLDFNKKVCFEYCDNSQGYPMKWQRGIFEIVR